MVEKKLFEYKEGIGFKFGMYASSITENISGVGISGLIKKMNSEGEATTAILHYFYGAAVSYCESKGLDKPTIPQVADWVESIGVEESDKIFRESLGLPKNSEAPKMETGQEQKI